MKDFTRTLAKEWLLLGPRFLPFADAASKQLPLGRLLRLSLFQISVGMASVLLTGTLNRVMVLELNVPAWLVSLMVSLPLLFAPFRTLIGFRSDQHRSAFGWRRVPYIWAGTLLQFGGLSIMPFSLFLLSGDSIALASFGPTVVMILGQVSAALAFLLVGAGMHTTQTAGLALATDLASPETRPRVVALLYVLLLIGMVGSSLGFGWFLSEFSNVRLIQVIQGAAVITMSLNLFALWKQEGRDPVRAAARHEKGGPTFLESWKAFQDAGPSVRLLVAIALGTAGFSMQDVLLEPYGGQVLHLSVGATTLLTALMATGTLIALALASQRLKYGTDPNRLAATGLLIGILAFVLVIFSAPMESPLLFRIGAAFIGFGSGLFAVSTLIVAMDLADHSQSGLALGAWGGVQATAAGLAIAFGGVIRDSVSELSTLGVLGPAFAGPSTSYGVVYHLEIALLFAALIAIGPLARRVGSDRESSSSFGLADFPG